MKNYQLIPRKTFVRAMQDILEQKNVEKRLIYLKSLLIIKDDFTPDNFIRMSWHYSKNESDLIKNIDTDQIAMFRKERDKVFIPVDDSCTESGLYSILPCNIADPDQLQAILSMLANKAYKDIYLATEFNTERLSMSMNSSISMSSSMLDVDAWTPAKEKIVTDRITKEYEEKLEKQHFDSQKILQDTISRLGLEKNEITQNLKQEIATGKNIAEHQQQQQQQEIAGLNAQIVSLNTQIGTLNGSVSTQGNKITSLNTRISAETTRASGLTSQISTLNSQLVTERNRISTLNSQLTAEQNKQQSFNSQISTLTNQLNATNVTLSTQDITSGGRHYVRISCPNRISLRAGSSTFGSVTANYFEVASR